MYNNQKFLILGFAQSGYEAAKLLIKRNNDVTINDNKTLDKINKDNYDELVSLGVKFVLGSHPDDLLDTSFDYLVKNPGVPIDHKYVLKAHELNVNVINEVEIAYNLIRQKNVKFISITGTNGKTTTTSLIYEMIKKEGLPVHLAGNIGYPLCSIVDDVKDNDIIVIEVSCQQLENMESFKPNTAVITNITSAHLEFMKTQEHYEYVKSKMVLRQTKEDTTVINNEDATSMKLSKELNSSIVKYSSNGKLCKCYLIDDTIYYNDKPVIKTSDIKLIGKHNYENIMASICAVKTCLVSDKTIINVLKTFNGVEHRLEFVKEVKGVKYYNDTEATNTLCTKIALSSFNKPTIVFLGGYERGQDFEELKDYIVNVKAIIAIGQNRNRVKEFADNHGVTCYVYETLKEGFKKSTEISQKDDIILLSPAAASWDQYERCEVRGAEFKDYVNNLEE